MTKLEVGQAQDGAEASAAAKHEPRSSEPTTVVKTEGDPTANDERLLERKERERGEEDQEDWPPKYVKLVLTFTCDSGGSTGTADDDGLSVWAFSDARRLGRLKLSSAVPVSLSRARATHANAQEACGDLERAEPLGSIKGRDAWLDLPTQEDLGEALARKIAPVKAVLLCVSLSLVRLWCTH